MKKRGTKKAIKYSYELMEGWDVYSSLASFKGTMNCCHPKDYPEYSGTELSNILVWGMIYYRHVYMNTKIYKTKQYKNEARNL